MNNKKSNLSPCLLCAYYDLAINCYVIKFIFGHNEKFIFTEKVARMNECVRLLEIENGVQINFYNSNNI